MSKSNDVMKSIMTQVDQLKYYQQLRILSDYVSEKMDQMSWEPIDVSRLHDLRLHDCLRLTIDGKIHYLGVGLHESPERAGMVCGLMLANDGFRVHIRGQLFSGYLLWKTDVDNFKYMKQIEYVDRNNNSHQVDKVEREVNPPKSSNCE